MAWRVELKLADIDDAIEIEVVCRTCKKHRYWWARELKGMSRLKDRYMDEVQVALVCVDKHCSGPQLVQIMHDHLNQGFVAGMP